MEHPVVPSRSELALVDYLTDPNPTPWQWDIQYYVWFHATRSGQADDELRPYFERLLEASRLPLTPGDSVPEHREMQHIATFVDSLEGVRWAEVCAAAKEFGRGEQI